MFALDSTCPVIGMVHLPALPGSPGWGGSLATVEESVRADVAALVDAGVPALMIENFGDVPFFPGRVPAITVAAITRLALVVRAGFGGPIGINVLRNDGLSALAVAVSVGASFIRVNVLSGARVTDQGLIQGIAHELMRERAALGARDIAVLADVDVKHSVPLGPVPLEVEVHDVVDRAGADALIVSGTGTGQPTDTDHLRRARAAARGRPVLVGSGATLDTLPTLAPFADGFIIGTAFKVGGVSRAPVDAHRTREILNLVRSLRRSP